MGYIEFSDSGHRGFNNRTGFVRCAGHIKTVWRRFDAGRRNAFLSPHIGLLGERIDEAGNVLIRDPQDATRYEMTKADFIEYWTRRGIWQNRGNE